MEHLNKLAKEIIKYQGSQNINDELVEKVSKSLFAMELITKETTSAARLTDRSGVHTNKHQNDMFLRVFDAVHYRAGNFIETPGRVLSAFPNFKRKILRKLNKDGILRWIGSNLLVDAPELAPLHINFKEALCIVFALRRWAPFLRDKTINIFCDNTAAVAMLNKGTTRNRVMMDYLRQLFWYSATYNFRLKVFHIPGKFNVWADHVSRLHQEEHFLALCQHQLSRFGPSALNSPATCHMSQLSYLFLLGLFGSGFYSHSAF